MTLFDRIRNGFILNRRPTYYRFQNKKILIVSYGQPNIDPKLYECLRKHYESIGVPLNLYVLRMKHAQFCDRIVRKNYDRILILDCDCLVLNRTALDRLLRNDGLTGVEQQANHLPEDVRKPYAGPACMTFEKSTYRSLGRPSFKPGPAWDVGGELTIRARERQVPIHLLEVSRCDRPAYPTGTGRQFGIGTYYENDSIYHHFHIRDRSEQLAFIKVMEEVAQDFPK